MLKHRAWISAGLFMALLCVPMVAGLFGGRSGEVSTLENRALAQWPAARVLAEDWPVYPAQADAWMGDHLGLRAWLIGVHQWGRDALDLTSDKRAVYGDGGWLFSNIDDVLAMHQGLRPFEAGEAEAWLEAAGALKTLAGERGAEFAVLIGPNKHEVYPEQLSAYPVLLNEMRRAEALEALGGDIPVIYPIEEMLAAKADGDVYYKTDTHWNYKGAYVAYRALMAKLDEIGLGAPTLGQDALTYAEPSLRQGDIYGLLGLKDQPGEPVRELLVKVPAPRTETELEDYQWSSFRATQTRMQHRAARGADLSVLVLGDSYYYSMAQFLEESFAEVTFIHHRGLTPPLDALETGEYDLVVLLLVERMLGNPLVIAQEEGAD